MQSFFALVLTVFGGVLFWGFFGDYEAEMILGFLMTLAGMTWLVNGATGPFEAHGHAGHDTGHANVGDPTDRSYQATKFARILLELFIALVVARYVFVGNGMTGREAFEEFILWFSGITIISYAQSVREVSGHPAQIAQMFFLRKRALSCFKTEGYRDFPLLGLWFTYKLQNVQTVDRVAASKPGPDGKKPDAPPFEVTTVLDFVKSWVSASFLWAVEDPIKYDNEESERGVWDRLYADVGTRLREWAISIGDGPATWKELKGSRIFALNAIARALFEAEQMPHIDGPFPTEFLLRYVEAPGWARTEAPVHLKDKWQEWSAKYEALTIEAKKALGDQLAVRRQFLLALQGGTAKVRMAKYGILMKRVLIGTIETEKKIEDAASDAEKERLEAVSQGVEQQNVIALAKAMMKPAPEGLGLTDAQEALKVAQRITEKLTSTESIFTIDVTAGGQSVAEAFTRNPALAALALKFLQDKGGKPKGGR